MFHGVRELMRSIKAAEETFLGNIAAGTCIKPGVKDTMLYRIAEHLYWISVLNDLPINV